MLDSFELFLLGCACVVDTVLLLVVIERINQARVAIWVKLLLAGTGMVHFASFFRLMMKPVEGATGMLIDHGCMVLLATGFLVLPSAMLHGAIRLTHTGVVAIPKFDRRYLLLYLPLLWLPIAVWLVFHSSDREFFKTIRPIELPFTMWLVLANTVSVFLFWRLRTRLSAPGAAGFFQRLSIAISVTTLLSCIYVFGTSASEWEFVVRLLTIMSPLIPAYLFVWYILHQRLLPLVIERTFVYGGVLAVLLLLHRLTITPWASAMGDRSNIDLALIEGMLVFGLIMVIRPLRERVLAALRYLLSRDVVQIRDAMRQISVQLSQQSQCSPQELIEWFSKALEEKIAVDGARMAWLDSPSPTGSLPITDSAEKPARTGGHQDLSDLSGALRQQTHGYLCRGDISQPRLLDAMERLNAEMVFRIAFRSVNGLAILGRRQRSDRLADEQLTALAMLCEQFAATLFNRRLELERLRAERQSMQQEKLAVLGLIAGSLAHELRNPLSSIRTIATLMKEDMPAGDEHLPDISMIIAEIDRLSQTTQRLLDYARPSESSLQFVVPDRVIERLLHILRQLARQHSVQIVEQLAAAENRVAADDASLSEIVFNLVRNAIEAAREMPDGRVVIESKVDERSMVITVKDNGHGIDPAVRQNLFQPFVTGKADGNGLGLYIAAERVRELSGTIRCESDAGQGSVFEVRLPLASL